jgi:hypothetical protein
MTNVRQNIWRRQRSSKLTSVRCDRLVFGLKPIIVFDEIDHEITVIQSRSDRFGAY